MENTKFIEELKEMTVLQLNDLVKAIEEEFGVTAAAPVAAAGGAAAEAESTEKTVKLVDAGAAKIKVIKLVRELTGLGLKEAKELVDAGGNIKENIDPAEAETFKAQLEELGASVELV